MQIITMKLLFHLCFLVLVISSVSRGKNTTDVPDVKEPKVEHREVSSGDQIKNETTASPEPEPYGKDSETLKPVTTQQLLNGSNNETTTPTTISPSTAIGTTGDGSEDKEVTSAAAGTTPAPAASSSKAGYVILVFIIIVIIILCIILYMLRKASRSYSFDLQRPAPSSRHDEPTGTFEQVYLDDLDRPVPKDTETTEDLPTTPVANGTGPQTEDKDTSEDNGTNKDSQEQPGANGVQNSFSSSSSSSSGDDQTEQASNQLSSNNLFFDAMEEPQQQNENNNNSPSVCSSLPFVEINLDEPAWCGQFLTSPQPTSSVYPFSSSAS